MTSSAPPHLAGLQLLADPVVVVDAGGTICYVNALCCRLLRVAAADLVGRPARQAIRLRTEAGANWWDSADLLDGDRQLHRRIAEQELNLQVGMTTRAVALTGARLYGGPQDGGLVLTIRRAEARRRRDAARSDLVSTVSHELRSPLTSVKGFTKTLLAKWDRFTDDQKKQMLATVNEDADRVTRLLGELLAVSRIDAGRLQLKRQMVSLPVLMPGVVSRIQAGIGRDRQVEVLGSQVPELYGDPDRLEQILTNLIENAVKYTDGAIQVQAVEGPEFVNVIVADEGEGIAPENHQAIFTKFFRAPGEKRQGTGLGLYITKGLVQAHGGEIWVDHRPEGTGSVFTFTLPKGGLELSGIDFAALKASVIPSDPDIDDDPDPHSAARSTR